MDHFAILTPYVIFCTVEVTLFRNVLSGIYGTLCGPLEIPGEPPLVHLDHIENHWVKRRNSGINCNRYYLDIGPSQEILRSIFTAFVPFALCRRNFLPAVSIAFA